MIPSISRSEMPDARPSATRDSATLDSIGERGVHLWAGVLLRTRASEFALLPGWMLIAFEVNNDMLAAIAVP